MFDIRQLTQLPEYGLRLYTDRLGDREVHAVQLLSESDWIGRNVENALIVTSSNFLGDHELLFRTLAAGRAAGLVVTNAPAEASMHTLHHAALRYGLPLLTSRHGLPQWKASLAAQVGDLSVASARQHAARLGMLLDGFRAAPADVPVRVAELIARELDADVVVSARGQILACAPPAAAVTLGPVLQNPDRRQQTTPSGHFARMEPLAATPDGVLAVARRDPYTPSARDLITHAANTLGTTLASVGAHRVDGEAQALTQIRLATFQMLMTGHTTDAQRVMAGVVPGLLDSDEARIVITDCAQAPRDTVMAEMEKHLDGAALSVRCPAYPQHIISVLPDRPGREDSCERVRQLLGSFHNARVSAGGSLPHPLQDIAVAYGEALDALLRAAQRAEPMVVTATRTPGLAEILPSGPARAWASNLLRPILTMQGGQEVLHSLGIALEFKTTAAARIIGVHRNTLHRRISKAFADIGCRPDRTLDRVVVSLALQIIGAHGPDLSGRHTASLNDVLSGQELPAWASKFLRPLAADPKDLLHTLRTWVLAEFDPDAAGAQLHVSGRTVRWRVQEAEPLMEKDLITIWPAGDEDPGEQRLSGIRPLVIALYATTPPGAVRPPLPDPTTRQSVLSGALS
ncbi:helix-turn-helix domain-containing protein [Streptomyces sp. NPDC001939]